MNAVEVVRLVLATDIAAGVVVVLNVLLYRIHQEVEQDERIGGR